jgi:ATP-dependent HslUV protease ATP-binding subunit HslU
MHRDFLAIPDFSRAELDRLFDLPDATSKRIVVDAALVREKLKAIVEDEDLRKYIL